MSKSRIVLLPTLGRSDLSEAANSGVCSALFPHTEKGFTVAFGRQTRLLAEHLNEVAL